MQDFYTREYCFYKKDFLVKLSFYLVLFLPGIEGFLNRSARDHYPCP
jgi:hypothetical protein